MSWARAWQGLWGPGLPTELSPALLNQAGPEGVEGVSVCVCARVHLCYCFFLPWHQRVTVLFVYNEERPPGQALC